MKVLGRLAAHGHQAFLVGGGVRDLLLGKAPKDFDVGTDATISEVRSIFRNSRIIGRRFKLVHVFFRGGKTIEVSTFRASNPLPLVENQGEDSADENASSESFVENPSLDASMDGGSYEERNESNEEANSESTESENVDLSQVKTLGSDNVYGDPESDAYRRDLTINGLFYNIYDKSIIDYVGGIEDLKNGVIRVIGDPEVRFKEDPVRILRAIRHSARTEFFIEPNTWQAIKNSRSLLALCPPARVYDEFCREVVGGYSSRSLSLMSESGILPELIASLSDIANEDFSKTELAQTLRKVDVIAKAGSPLPLEVVLAALTVDVLSPEKVSEITGIRLPLCEALWNSECPLPADLGSVHEMREEVSKGLFALYNPLRMTRRVRDLLADILVQRALLVTVALGAEDRAKEAKGEGAKHAFKLLRLLCQGENADQTCNYWFIKSASRSRSDESPSRRRDGYRGNNRNRGRGRQI